MNYEELKMLQSYPLELKIAKSKQRIIEFVSQLGIDNVYVSFSGGKDSTVLLHLVRSIYPEVEGVFSNTGLEFPELVQFAKSKENITEVRPVKSFKQVIFEEGYPIISKKTARMIHDCQNPTDKNARSRKLYTSDYTLDENGDYTDKKNNAFKIAKKWRKLINAPFKVSHKCCDYLKKKPIKEYEKKTGKRPIIGVMASESKMRESSYLQIGCNSFKEKHESCTPLGFWTEQDIFEYIINYKLDYAFVYGEIYKDENGIYQTTGEKRTGCVFCGFFAKEEQLEERLLRLEETHPQLHKYCMDQLGFKEVYEYMGIKYSKEKEKVKEECNVCNCCKNCQMSFFD